VPGAASHQSGNAGCWQRRRVDDADVELTIRPDEESTMNKRIINVALAGAIVAVAAGGYVSLGPAASAKAVTSTSTVTRSTVLATVTASGNVTADQQLSLNFAQSGTITEVDVKAGQHVAAGQVLAKVQSQSQQDAVASAQANLTSAQQKLAADPASSSATSASDQASLATAQAQVTSAQDALTAAQSTATSDAATQAANVASAQTKLGQDEVNDSAAQAADQAQLTADQAQLTADQAPGSSYAQKITTDTNNQNSACGQNATLCTNAQAALLADQATLAAKLASDQAKIVADQKSLQADSTLVANDQTALVNVRNTQASVVLKDQQAITAATDQVGTAQASLASAKAMAASHQVGNPATRAADVASVTSATQQLDSAKKNLADTTLTAPTGGTVAVIANQVGETAGAANGSSSSSGAFITLTNLDTLEIKAGFSETDAAKIKIGQPATVTFDALPSVNVNAHVTHIDTNQTLVSNVVTYYVILVLDNTAAGVKPGMTASAAVVTSERDNVLSLPSSAVSGTGSTATVQVQVGAKTVTRSVTIGLRGDTAIEITSGLADGDKVVTSQAGGGGLPSGFRLPAGAGGGLSGGLGGR
jgi:multidrug efflux pump subunit AcrA (membrane-fusion protein)